MGTSFIPGPGDKLQRALAGIGQAIGQIIDPNRERRRKVEELLLTNPQIGQQFAKAQREAEAGFFAPEGKVAEAREPAPNVMETFGFSREQTRRLFQAFPPTAEEKLDVPGLQARAQAEQLKFQSTLFSQMNELGVPTTQALGEAMKQRLNRELTDVELTRLGEWQTRLNELATTNRPEFLRALAATQSPEFLRDIQFREELALKREIAENEGAVRRLALEAEQAESEADRFFKLENLRTSLEGALSERLEELFKMVDEGNDAGALVSAQRVNQQASRIRAIAPFEPSFSAEVREKLFGLGVRVEPIAPRSLAALSYEDRLLAETMADAVVQLKDQPFNAIVGMMTQGEKFRGLMGKLGPAQRSDFLSSLEALHTQQQGVARPEIRGTGRAAQEQRVREAARQVETADVLRQRIVELRSQEAALKDPQSPKAIELRRQIATLTIQLARARVAPAAEERQFGIPRRVP